MSFRKGEANTRKQVARFSVNEWIAFRKRLRELNESGCLTERDYKILYELIFEQKSTAQLAYLAKTDESYSWLKSNQDKPISCRRVQQILTDYFPEFHIQKTHKIDTAKRELRREQLRLQSQAYKEHHKCGRCGSDKNLELHHLFPVVLGGTNDDRNFIWLCHDCHTLQSLYFLERLRQMKKEGDICGGKMLLPLPSAEMDKAID